MKSWEKREMTAAEKMKVKLLQVQSKGVKLEETGYENRRDNIMRRTLRKDRKSERINRDGEKLVRREK
jgi:hypothetical protein